MHLLKKMIVNSDNFHTVYSSVREHIFSADFISIDEEMTGIHNKQNRNKRDDTPSKRYEKMLPVASKYSIIQFGLTAFMKDTTSTATTPCYVAYPYTFYLFPENNYSDIVMNPESIDFLKKNGMDFQQWIAKGITFVNSKDEKAKAQMYNQVTTTSADTSTTTDSTNRIVLTTSNDIEFMTRNMNNFKAVVNDDQQHEFVFEYCNAFLKKYIYQVIQADYPSVQLEKDSDGRLVAKKSNQAEIEAEQKLKYQHAVGFKQVFNDLITSKKPLVGHNLFFDLLFLIKWMDGNLDNTLDQFIPRLNELFPFVYDTKYIAASGAMNNGEKYDDTALDDIYNTMVLKKNKVGADVSDSVNCSIVDIKFGSSDYNRYDDSSNKQSHDAGYDSYMTGALFAHELTKVTDISIITNKLFMMQSLYHMDLNPSNSIHGVLKFNGSILHVSFTDTSIDNNRIHELFKGIGIDNTMIDFIWLDSTSTFLCINERCSMTYSEIMSELNTTAAAASFVFQSYDDYYKQVSDAACSSATVINANNKRLRDGDDTVAVDVIVDSAVITDVKPNSN